LTPKHLDHLSTFVASLEWVDLQSVTGMCVGAMIARVGLARTLLALRSGTLELAKALALTGHPVKP
jgi:hypothetical protein